MSLIKVTYKVLAACFSMLWIVVQGQHSTPMVEVKAGADSIYLGSQTDVTFSVATPGDYLWQWPELHEKLTDKIEIVNQTGIDTTRQRRSDLVKLSKRFAITSFDSGFHAVPPFSFQYKMPGDTVWFSLETEPFLLYVAGFDVDLSIPIRDIKPPARAPVTFLEILPWLLLLILIAAGILWYRHYLQKKKSRIALLPKPAKPKIPPHRRALDALEQLQQKKLWQSGRIKEYHSEITDILRRYLEERFNIMAVEMTTSEIIEALPAQPVPPNAIEKLLVIFERADLVKFAKSTPVPSQHEESFMMAIDFVRATIPVAVEAEALAGSANNGSQKTDNRQ